MEPAADTVATVDAVDAADPLAADPVVGRRALLARVLGRRALAPAGVGLGAALLAACDLTDAPFDREVHLLRRLTYGPTPATRAHIEAIGESAWLAEQLDPGRLDLTALQARLAAFPALGQSTQELFTQNPDERTATLAAAQLRLASIIRAVESPAQLFERMVEFWSDHFNVPGEGRELNLLKIVEDREVIRRHALGKFKDLLVASAQSPAMLLYLDNFRSFRGAINENYSREALELHTVGVKGGYTEADVVSLARLLTGWTIDRTTGTFVFRGALHDPAPLTIMGWTRPTTGTPLQQGVAFLHWLALRPETARFVCRKLAVRFVRDDPDASLVDAMAAAWLAHDSAIGPVLRAMVAHPSFDAARNKKFRRPLDYQVWLLRVLQARVATATTAQELEPLRDLALALGQMPFGWPAPNGYPDVEGAWLNSGALLTRWNFVGDLLAQAYAPLITFDARAFRATLDGKTAAQIYDAFAQATMLESVTEGGRILFRDQLGWTDSYRPRASEIDAALPTIALAVLASVDAQYR